MSRFSLSASMFVEADTHIVVKTTDRANQAVVVRFEPHSATGGATLYLTTDAARSLLAALAPAVGAAIARSEVTA